MNQGDVLELLHTAHEHFSAISIEWTYEYHVQIINEVFASQNTSASSRIRDSGSMGEEDVWRKMWWRVRWQKPFQFREEYGYDNSEQPKGITVINHEQTMIAHLPEKKVHRQIMPIGHGGYVISDKNSPLIKLKIEEIAYRHSLLYPSFLLASHDLRVAKAVHYLNREAIQVDATHRKGIEVYGHDSFFWKGADRYELLIDSQQGVLLSYSAQKDDQIFASVLVKQVAYNESFSDNTFSTETPWE